MNTNKKTQRERKKERISFAISKEHSDTLKKHADEHGLSKSAYIRFALIEYEKTKYRN